MEGLEGEGRDMSTIAIEFDGRDYYEIRSSGERTKLIRVSGDSAILEIEKEITAWRERFPEYRYDHESGLICYKVSKWEEEN